jgi:hypothetical protein
MTPQSVNSVGCSASNFVDSAQNALGEAFTTSLESAKWKLWHGHPQEALTKLAVLRDNLTEEGHCSKLIGLYEYLHRNQVYLVNYDACAQAHKTYTSQVAESQVVSLNSRDEVLSTESHKIRGSQRIQVP